MIEKNLDKGHAFLATLALPSPPPGASKPPGPPPVAEPLALDLLRRGLLPDAAASGDGAAGGGGAGAGKGGAGAGKGGGQAVRMPTVAGTFRRQLVRCFRPLTRCLFLPPSLPPLISALDDRPHSLARPLAPAHRRVHAARVLVGASSRMPTHAQLASCAGSTSSRSFT